VAAILERGKATATHKGFVYMIKSCTFEVKPSHAQPRRKFMLEKGVNQTYWLGVSKLL